MKITEISVDNFLGARQVQIKCTAPVTLIAGDNNQGKSSIRDAIKMAITQEVDRVALKKDYGQLVTDNGKAGGALICVGEQSYRFNVTAAGKASFDADEGLPQGVAIATALDGQRFADMTEADRRKFILSVSGTKVSPTVVKEKLLAKQLNAEHVETVLPMLRTGFADAEAFAKNKATEHKGAWKKITNTTYGKIIAESWVAEKPEAVTCEYTDDDLTAIMGKIGLINQEIGTLKAKRDAQTANANKLATLKADAEALTESQARLVRLTGEREELATHVEDLRARATGKRVGLVHDMALFITFNAETDDQEAIDLIARYEAEHGKPVVVDADPQAIAALPENEKGLIVLQTSITNLTRDIARSEAATEELSGMANTETVDYDSQIAALNQQKVALNESYNKVSAEMLRVTGIEHQRATAEKNTLDAANEHKAVTEWLAIADALAPAGIPSELLCDALKPINSALNAAAAHTGWYQVHIDGDVQITANERPYALLSKSEQWRVNAMIAVAIAQVSGLKIVMLDEVDILSPANRITLLTWLNEIAGEIDTALLFATMKQMPSGLPETISAHWMERGVVQKLKVAA
jgi:DNA repair exonuclease SbcCD ATPase subunit